MGESRHCFSHSIFASWVFAFLFQIRRRTVVRCANGILPRQIRTKIAPMISVPYLATAKLGLPSNLLELSIPRCLAGCQRPASPRKYRSLQRFEGICIVYSPGKVMAEEIEVAISAAVTLMPAQRGVDG